MAQLPVCILLGRLLSSFPKQEGRVQLWSFPCQEGVPFPIVPIVTRPTGIKMLHQALFNN